MANDKVLDFMQNDWNLSIEEVESRFDTHSKYGLEDEEAKVRLETDGLNYHHEIEGPSELYKLFSNLVGIHNLPLWFGATLYILAFAYENNFLFDDVVRSDKFYIGIGLIIFVLSFGIFSYYMEAKCEYYVESCRDLVESYSIVIRDGVYREILKEHLVVGDLIVLNHGDQLMTDVKLIESINLTINIELLEQRERYYYKQLYGTLDRNFQVGDILLHSSYIATGYGKGIVIGTKEYYASKSNIKFRMKIRTIREEMSPLTFELSTFLHYLSLIAILISAVLASISLLNGFTWLEATMFFIALYVGIITEALLPTLNVCKTQISKDLASKNCYIKNISVLETLGKTRIICTNKTGVLTQDKMIVSQLWLDHQLIHSYDFIRQYKGCPLSELKEPIRSFIECCTFCNFAHFTSNEKELSSFLKNAIGKPTEIALLRFIDAFWSGRMNVQRRNSNQTTQSSFKKINNYSATVHDKEDVHLIYIKSQPEILIEKAEFFLKESGPIKMNLYEKARLFETCCELASKKERVLAVGKIEVPKADNTETLSDLDNLLELNNICFIGLIILQNPVRLSVPEAVFKCQRAGVKVIMTTGDHPCTALSVAKLIGLVKSRNTPTVFTGGQLDQMSDIQIQDELRRKNNLVLGRITNNSKLRLVSCCHTIRSIVALTGVGSDCLSLFEHSHVRISLGKYGSDVTKNNSDIILLDDNFSSIVYGIEQGRVLFENIKKSLCYTLSSKPPELLMWAMPFIFQIPRIGSAITLVAIDLFTDNLPPIALAYEQIETHVMERDSKSLNKSKTIKVKMLVLSMLFYGLFQFLPGLLVYLVVMGENGFWWSDLINLKRQWYSLAVNDLTDSYGQEWTFKARQDLEFTCHTAYFVTIVINRVAVLVCCRTTHESYFQNMFRNQMINFAIFFLLFFSLFLTYYPPFQYSIRMYPLKFNWWLVGIPFSLAILAFDECRKLFIRHYPQSEIAKIIDY